MKLALCSDLHLEFGDLVLKNTENADVLILSGDICVAKDLGYVNDLFDKKSQKLHSFFKQVCEEFEHVLYVMGNHEHYHGDFAITYQTLKDRLAHLKNLHLLEKETHTIGEVTFIGGTLWTDMNDEDSMTLHAVRDMMNDFRTIKNSNRTVARKVPLYKKDDNGEYVSDENGSMIHVGMKIKETVATLAPTDVVDEFRKTVDYISMVINNNPNQKYVMVGHHAPSKASTHPRYQNDTLINGAYSSNLDFFIEDHPEIKLWTHGHTHHTFDYMIGETRVVCNPRGYIGYEDQADIFKLKYVDI